MIARICNEQSLSGVVKTQLAWIPQTTSTATGSLQAEVKGDRFQTQLTIVLVMLHSCIHEELKLCPMSLPNDVIEQLATWTDDYQGWPASYSQTLPKLNLCVVNNRMSDPVPAVQ